MKKRRNLIPNLPAEIEALASVIGWPPAFGRLRRCYSHSSGACIGKVSARPEQRLRIEKDGKAGKDMTYL
jgi:hypothetical protein